MTAEIRHDSQDTPTLLIHGNKDEVVPLVNSEKVYLALNHVGVPVELQILDGWSHAAWDAMVADGRTLYQTTYDFIVQQQNLPNE